MNPVLQLDPASLGLWLGYPRQETEQASSELREAAWAALFGTVTDVLEIIDQINHQRKIRAIDLASAIWHEQRHFLDLLLTNHGAFSVRQYLAAYLNVPQILGATRSLSGSVTFPLDAYMHPVRRRLYGLHELDPEVSRAVQDITGRMEMAIDDRAMTPTAIGDVETGGKAQLEALAYIYQMVRVQELFGTEALRAVHDQLPYPAEVHRKYMWIIHILVGLGVFPRQRGVVVYDAGVVAALLVGALATRRWGQKQIRHEFSGSGFAGERLAGLLKVLGPRWAAEPPDSVVAAWHDVNDAAEWLWSRSVLDEMKDDMRHEAEFIAVIESGLGQQHAVTRFARDLYRSRTALFAILDQDPAAILQLDRVYEAIEIHPPVVIAEAHSIRGAPPRGWDRLFGYRDPEGGEEWWWAASPAPPRRSSELTLADRDAWLHVVSDYAPVAKLMMHGLRHRIILGPEIMTVQQRLRASGVKVRYEPDFAYPVEAPDTPAFWYHTGRATARCDACLTSIARPGGHCISPWTFRLNGRIADWAISKYGGERSGHLAYLADWSPWLLCDGCLLEVADIVGSRGSRFLGL